MKKQILEYLDSFEDNDYHELNHFLQHHFKENSLVSIRKNFSFLQNFKMIEVMDETHNLLGAPVGNSEGFSTINGNLENCIIQARIITKGRNIVDEIKNAPIKSTKISGRKKQLNKFIPLGLMVATSITIFYFFIKKYFKLKNKLTK